MRKYVDLNDVEKEIAFNKGLQIVLDAAGKEVFPELEDHVEAADIKASELNTPWFFGAILYQDIEGAKEIIDELVVEYIENALYPEDGEYVITL